MAELDFGFVVNSTTNSLKNETNPIVNSISYWYPAGSMMNLHAFAVV